MLLIRLLRRCGLGEDQEAAGAKQREAAQAAVRSAVLGTAHRLLSARVQALQADYQDGLINEFESLRDVSMTDMMTTFDAAEANARKNRYTNVLPYDFNRVKLEDKEGSDYINASFVHVPSEQGDIAHVRYIAAMGPLPSTTGDFWEMCVQQKVARVINLTRAVEKNHVKCAEYFPVAQGETSQFGNYHISNLVCKRVDQDVVARTLELKHTQTGEVHQLEHLHYHLWPDHGVPISSASIRHLSRVLWSGPDQPAPLQVVHCSAGIGRTGAYITIDIILRRLWALCDNLQAPPESAIEEALDVPGVVHTLRRMRRGMVQTLDQYEFIYKTILEELQEQLGIVPATEQPAAT